MLVSREAGAALVLADGGVQHRDGFGEGDGDVVVGGGLAGGPGGFAFEFDEPFGGGVRLGRLEPGAMGGGGGGAGPGAGEPSVRARGRRRGNTRGWCVRRRGPGFSRCSRGRSPWRW